MEGNKEKAQKLQGLPSINDIKNENSLVFALDKDDRIVFADKGFITFVFLFSTRKISCHVIC